MEIVNMEQLMDELLAKAAESKAARAARALRSGREHYMRHTVLALLKDAVLADHENPGEASLLVLRGTVKLTAGDDSWELAEGEYCDIPEMRHGLISLADSVVMLSTLTR